MSLACVAITDLSGITDEIAWSKFTVTPQNNLLCFTPEYVSLYMPVCVMVALNLITHYNVPWNDYLKSNKRFSFSSCNSTLKNKQIQYVTISSGIMVLIQKVS